MIKEMFSDTESFKSNIKLKINAVLIELKTVVKNYLSLGSRASFQQFGSECLFIYNIACSAGLFQCTNSQFTLFPLYRRIKNCDISVLKLKELIAISVHFCS